MKRCSKCIMPETWEGITFDQEGVCSMCRAHQDRDKTDWEEREKEFRKIMERYKDLAESQGNPYDCIVPFSGGKDSTYTLYTLIKDYGVKPLVVTFDHLFFTDTIRENQRNVLRKLGVDHIMFSPNWQVVKKLCAKSLKMSGDFCWHCHCGIYAYPVQIAVKYRIPLLVWGSTDYTLPGISPLRDWKFFQKYVNLGLRPEEMLGDEIIFRDLQPYIYPSAKELKDLNIIGINQGDYLRWNVRKQVGLIKKELGWKGRKVEGSFVDYDKVECKYIAIRDYLKFLKRGFGRSAQLASVDVRDGLMSREQALEIAKEYDGKRPAVLDEFLKKIDMREKEFNKYALKHKVSKSE